MFLSGLPALLGSGRKGPAQPGGGCRRSVRDQGAAQGASQEGRCRRRGNEALPMVSSCCQQLPLRLVEARRGGHIGWRRWHGHHSQIVNIFSSEGWLALKLFGFSHVIGAQDDVIAHSLPLRIYPYDCSWSHSLGTEIILLIIFWFHLIGFCNFRVVLCLSI